MEFSKLDRKKILFLEADKDKPLNLIKFYEKFHV